MILSLLAATMAVSLAPASSEPPLDTPLNNAVAACIGMNVNEAATAGAGAYPIGMPPVEATAVLSADLYYVLDDGHTVAIDSPWSMYAFGCLRAQLGLPEWTWFLMRNAQEASGLTTVDAGGYTLRWAHSETELFLTGLWTIVITDSLEPVTSP